MVARWPNNTERLTIVGKTGSGKTQLSTWQLSTRNWDRVPWIIVDFKEDPLLGRIPAKLMRVDDPLPDEAGLYRVSPDAVRDEQAIEDMLDGIHKHGNMGLYIDEGYQIPMYSEGLSRVFTQGRSRRIPVIFVSQRPAWVNKFAYTETEFIVAFHLNAESDQKRVRDCLPKRAKVYEERLPPYHAYHYDVTKDRLAVLTPVESEEEILNRFQTRYEAMHADDTIQEDPPNVKRFRIV